MGNSNLCLLLLLLLFGVGCDCNKDVPLFIFGDSIVETGNNNYMNTTPIAQSNYYPFGQSFFKFPTGRWSDGRIVPDFIAEFANLRLVLPYLYPGNKRHYIDGINFASGGAGARPELNRALGIMSLETQLSKFKKVEKSLRKQLGKTEAKTLLSRAVYYFSIGSNDYRTFIEDSNLYNSYSFEKYVDLVLGNITSIIKGIHKKGGRKFVVLNLGSFSHLPIMKELVASQGKHARLEQLNQIGGLHNIQLYKALQKLTTKLEGFRYSYVDTHKVLDEIISNSAKYGLKEVNVACCGSGKFKGILQSCGGKSRVNEYESCESPEEYKGILQTCREKRGVQEYELCENPEEYLFFDFGHLTDRGNQIFAEMIWNGDSNSSIPVNVKSLFHS